MAVGVGLLIVVLSIFNGFQRQVKKSLWEGGPHITIENQWDGGAIVDYNLLVQFLKATPELEGRLDSIQPIITSHGLLQNQNSFTPIMIRAVPIESPELLLSHKVPNFPKLALYDREQIEGIKSKSFLIAGKELMNLYNVYLGKKISIAVPGGKFSMSRGVEVSSGEFVVAGFFKTGYYSYDSKFLFLSLSQGQELFKLKNAVNQIAIKVKSLEDLKMIKSIVVDRLHSDELESKIKKGYSFNVRTIAEEQENFLAALKLEKTILSIIVFLFIILAAMGMVATVYSLVRAKRKSIGTLKALGLSSDSILIIFTLNALLVGILASIVGGIVGVFIAIHLESIVNGLSAFLNWGGHIIYGIHWRNVELVPKDIYYFDHIPVELDIHFLFMVTTAATILSGLAGYLPARWAANLNPVHTIRNE
jgi:lipoprotein-releasing system permease protein